MVALFQRCRAQSLPHILPVHGSSHLHSDGQVSALDSEVKSRLLVLHKVKGDLRISFLLQVANDALSHEVRGPDDLKDLVVVLAD